MRMMYRKHGHFLIYDKSKYTATITKNTKKRTQDIIISANYISLYLSIYWRVGVLELRTSFSHKSFPR